MLEWLIRLCGVSAILFVFGIFFFVFREGAGLFFGELNLREFLFTHRVVSDLDEQRRVTACWR